MIAKLSNLKNSGRVPHALPERAFVLEVIEREASHGGFARATMFLAPGDRVVCHLAASSLNGLIAFSALGEAPEPGVHKPSLAMQRAIDALGIELFERNRPSRIGGRGCKPVRLALDAIARACRER